MSGRDGVPGAGHGSDGGRAADGRGTRAGGGGVASAGAARGGRGLPAGSVVRLNRRVRVRDGGRTLVGGAPIRVMHLSEAAVGLFEGRALRIRDRATAVLADRLLETGIADPVVQSLPEGDLAEVTYVIPVRDRPQQLARLLEGLGGATGRVRVIVVDDASVDAEGMRRVADAHGARFVALPENVGPAGARNVGLRLVTTPFVVFADSDVVAYPDAVATLLRHFADPAVALAAPRVLGLPREPGRGRTGTSRNATGLNGIGRYEDARSSLDLGEDPAIVRQRAPVSWVSSTFLVGRVALLGEGFTAGMRVGEDVDLVWTLADQGLRVRYEPAATVWHEHRDALGSWLARKAFYGTGAHPLALRHPHDIAPAVLAPWSAGVVAALLAQRRWSVPVALGISAVTVWRLSRRLSKSGHPVRLAAWLTANGLVASLVQAMALLLRHLWPAVAVGCLFSARLRRAVLVAHLLDVAIEHRRTKVRLDPVRFAVLRRLDDLAYGAGVWVSAFRGRSWRALLPDIRSSRR
ncbi:mycofactocin biosynthesis glycosyltransferase MftF [Herbiconiux sp. 11R-BC]|uniref:mycofactocin biosynthesis glycosyltransferase MftF n=1 Tax=Herbiconiux sp. 11R-BC TaxID=3111637 RepID=UPI003C0900DA